MPIYSFKCEKCGFVREELRKMEDTNPPSCIYCDIPMDRLFSMPAVIVGGPEATQEKLRRRSNGQGKRFFSRAAYRAEKR